MDIILLETKESFNHIQIINTMRHNEITREQLLDLHFYTDDEDITTLLKQRIIETALCRDTSIIDIPNPIFDYYNNLKPCGLRHKAIELGLKLDKPKDIDIDLSLLELSGDKGQLFTYESTDNVVGCFNLIGIRALGEYRNKGFYLNTDIFNWELKKDEFNNLCLIPTLKA